MLFSKGYCKRLVNESVNGKEAYKSLIASCESEVALPLPNSLPQGERERKYAVSILHSVSRIPCLALSRTSPRYDSSHTSNKQPQGLQLHLTSHFAPLFVPLALFSHFRTIPQFPHCCLCSVFCIHTPLSFTSHFL